MEFIALFDIPEDDDVEHVFIKAETQGDANRLLEKHLEQRGIRWTWYSTQQIEKVEKIGY